MRDNSVIFRQFAHNPFTESNKGDSGMADIIWDSAQLAGFTTSKRGPISTEEVRLSGNYIGRFCNKIMVLARNYGLREDATPGLKRIIHDIEDSPYRTLVISRTENFTTIHGLKTA